MLSYALLPVVQSLSHIQLCDPMNCSTPGFPVYHYLLEFAQTHVHWNSDAIQPPHPLSSPSLALNLSQHQGLFQWFGSLQPNYSQHVSNLLELQLQHQSLQWILRVDFLYQLVWIPCNPRDTFESLLHPHRSKASILQCSAFFMDQLSLSAYPLNITATQIQEFVMVHEFSRWSSSQEALGTCRDWLLFIIWQWSRNLTLIPEAVFLLVYLVSVCNYGESCIRIKRS